MPPAPPIAPRLTTAAEEVAPAELRPADVPACVPHAPLVPAPAVARLPSPLAREVSDGRESTGMIDVAHVASKARVLPFAEATGADDEPATQPAFRAEGALPFAAPALTAPSPTRTLPPQSSPLAQKAALPFAAPEEKRDRLAETQPFRQSPLAPKADLPFQRPAAAPPPPPARRAAARHPAAAPGGLGRSCARSGARHAVRSLEPRRLRQPLRLRARLPHARPLGSIPLRAHAGELDGAARALAPALPERSGPEGEMAAADRGPGAVLEARLIKPRRPSWAAGSWAPARPRSGS